MTWTSGETIVASRLEDKNDRNITNGYAGIDSQLLINSAIITNFNLIKIISTNIFTNTVVGTGSVTTSNANGTTSVSTPANGDDASSVETDKIALSGLPRIIIFKINAITISGAQTQAGFGLNSATDFVPGASTYFAAIVWDGSAWSLYTNNNGANTSTAITAPTTNDVFIFYCTSTRISIYKNGSHIATHTANIPTGAMGRAISVLNTSGGGGNIITLGFIS